MRHFSEYEKKIIKLIVGMKPEEASIFGNYANKTIFPSGECALLIRNYKDPDHINDSFFFTKEKPRLYFAKLFEVLALIKYLEEERLIYLCLLNKASNFFYQDKGEKIEVVGNELRFADNQFVLNSPKGVCIVKEGKRILQGTKIDGELSNTLSRIFSSVIYWTPSLRKLVENNFVPDEERRYRKQLRQTGFAIAVAIIGVIVSPVLSVLLGNCHGRTTLKGEQYEGLKSAIISSNKEGVPEAVCPVCVVSWECAPDSIKKKCH